VFAEQLPQCDTVCNPSDVPLTTRREYLKSIRRYLVEEAGFHDVAVIATVATGFASRQSCLIPYWVTDNRFHGTFGLRMRGLFFRFIVGDDTPSAMQAVCCAGPD
jgi:hypothetical protein